MSKGKRYDTEPKLNMKKVFAVIIAIAVIIMFIYVIKGVLEKGKDTGKLTSKNYFAVFKDNKWGVIDSSGNTVIDPAYREMIVIPNNKIDVFICTYDVNYETGDYKTKVLNSKNEEIWTNIEKVEPITNQDNSQNMWYEEVLRFQKDGKYGLIDFEGKEILAPEYDKITSVQGIKNILLIEKEQKVGIADNKGEIIIPAEYKEITNLGEDSKSGFIVTSNEDKQGIVDYTNTKILETNFDKIQKVYGNNLYVVTQDEKEKLVGKDGQDILTTGFDNIIQICKETEENSNIIYKEDNKYGVMKITGEVVIEPIYDNLKQTSLGTFIAKKGENYGIINWNNEEKLEFNYIGITYSEKADIYIAEKEDNTADFLNYNLEKKLQGIFLNIDVEKGYLKVRVGEDIRYYNFRFEEKKDTEILTSNTLFLRKKDGKYGLVDKNENIVVDYQYDDAVEQNIYGYVAVKKDGKWGSIDSKGNVVCEPTYNLDSYFYIDFIGRWHLGQDLNMNYYNMQ